MRKLAVIFPGIGYTCDKPLLFYAEKLAIKSGYEIKRIAYSLPGDRKIRGDKKKIEEAFRFLYTCTEDSLSDTDFSQYNEILFISKSIGTAIACAYADKYKENTVRHVLYTPLEATFGFRPQNAISFLGTKDPWSVPEDVIRLAKEAGVPMHVYENANHSLETGDVLKDIDILKDVMEKTERFIG